MNTQKYLEAQRAPQVKLQRLHLHFMGPHDDQKLLAARESNIFLSILVDTTLSHRPRGRHPECRQPHNVLAGRHAVNTEGLPLMDSVARDDVFYVKIVPENSVSAALQPLKRA